VLLESIGTLAPMRTNVCFVLDIRVLRHLGQLSGLRAALAR
jgi:hypothetical protein